MKAENRARFKANERAYLDEWPMTEEQKQAVLARDYNRLIELGGNIYFLAKIFATDGKSFQYAAALMTGMSQEAYATDDAERRPLAERGRRVHSAGDEVMARITAGIACSHVPAIGAAIDLGKTAEPYWAPLFKGFEFSKHWMAQNTPDVVFLDLQRSRDGVQPRHHSDVRDRLRGRVQAGRRRLGPAAGAGRQGTSRARERTSRSR